MLINTRDVPVAIHFTKVTLKHEFYFNVGIGKTDFNIIFNVQQHNGKVKIDVTYNSTTIGNVDWNGGLIYIIGEVTTVSNQPFIKIIIEGDVVENIYTWLLSVVCVLTCDDASPAPKPYRVKNNTTGTAIIAEATTPAWMTTTVITTDIPGTTTPFDPSPINPPFPSVAPTVAPTGGDGTNGGPPGPTTTPQPGISTTPPPTQGFTSAVPPTFPPTPEVTPEPTVQPTASPTTSPFVLDVYGYDLSEGIDPILITNTNKDTVCNQSRLVNNLRYITVNENGQLNAVYVNYFISTIKLSGGSESYRLKYEGIVPGIYPLRAITSTTVVTPEESADSIIYNTNGYKDLLQYKPEKDSLVLAYDNSVRCLGFETTGPQKLKIIADDGYTTLEQELTWYRANYISLSNTIVTVIDNYVNVAVPIADALTNDLVFNFIPTEDNYQKVDVPNGGHPTIRVDFGNGKQNTGYFNPDTSEHYLNYLIKDGYAHSKVKVVPDNKYANTLGVNKYGYWYWYSGGHYGSHYYQVMSPIALGVLTISLKNKITEDMTQIHKGLYWYCNRGNHNTPYGHWWRGSILGQVADYTYT